MHQPPIIMRFIISCLLLLVSSHSFCQSIPQLSATIGNAYDFGPAVQKEWAIRDAILADMNAGKRSWEDLSEREKAIFEKYGEVYEDMYDAGGAGCSWYCGGGPSKVSASSTLGSQGNNTYEAENAHDLDLKTAWVEGVKGYGIGEYLEYEFPAAGPRINTIIIANGYVKSQTAWKNNSRVKQLKMYLDGKPVALLNLKDINAQQSFKVEPLGQSDRSNLDALKDHPNWKLRFEIMDVYKGDKYDDVVITDLFFDGLDVHCLGAGTLIRMADGSEKPIENLQIGEEVMSYNLSENRFEPASILELANPMHDHLIELQFEHGEPIVATRDHPFFDGLKWKSYAPGKTMKDYHYDAVQQLKVGDVLGEKRIVAIKELEGFHPTYTIVRLSRNSVFVANGVLTGTEELRERMLTD